jgi:CrcB protein
MRDILLVALGGAIGSVARYKLGGLVLHRWVDFRFPVSTFTVNVIGCFIAGALAGLIERYEFFSPHVRVFLFTGVLGGFTTFSAFGLETATLLRRGDLSTGSTYALLSVVCGVAAFWVGLLPFARGMAGT